MENPLRLPLASCALLIDTWDLGLQTANGPGTPVFTFKQDGGKQAAK